MRRRRFYHFALTLFCEENPVKSQNRKQALVMCLLIAVVAIVAVFAPVAYSCGLFGHCRTAAVEREQLGPIVATAVTTPATPVTAAGAEKRCLLPWNCPNGHCKPDEQINVNVVAPPRIEGVPPVNVSIEPAPLEPRFPFGLLFAVLIPVIVLASIAAFVIRVSTSRV
jgi:hypothetical protein